MLQSAAARYEQVKITTASKGELLVALYEGMFKFLRGAKICFEQNQPARGRELSSKAYAIINELLIALDPKVDAEFCQTMTALYGFCLDRLRAANLAADPSAINDVMRAMSPLKDAWEQAVPEAARLGICHRAE